MGSPLARSASTPAPRRSSPAWATLCAETLAGIADPLFPALSLARVVAPDVAGRAALAALLEPIDTPARTDELPDWLLEHQADAVRRARAILDRFGGALVADGVGLGKTYIALALAALERRTGRDAAAIVPAALRAEWRRAMDVTGVAVPLFSHTELALRTPQLPPRCSLLLVDEAHGFRNSATRRYDTLARLAIGRRVALLTATPVNNSPSDLAALLHLFAARDRFRELGVADIAAALRAGDGAAALALGAVSVCRTRRLVERRFPRLARAFPRRILLPPVRYDLAACYGGRPGELLSLLELPHGGAAESAGPLMALGLVRRMESSRHALRRSLLRHRAFLEEWRRAREGGVELTRRAFQAAVPRGDGDDSQLALWPLLAPPSGGPALDPSRWLDAVNEALELLGRSAEADDPKLAALERLLDEHGSGRKAIVFTEYRDTALALFRQLRRRRRVILVLGDGARAGQARLSRRAALDAFAPLARGARADPLLEADVLVATDVASEGMNLQDAAMVVNYDLPWNPVRVMQRVGRIDRLDSANAEVRVAHLVAAGGLAELCGVLARLKAKLEMASDAAPGTEPDPLASLWWLGGDIDPDRIERESWRRVAPFESREDWRMELGSVVARTDAPLVAAGVADDAGAPSAGLLLAVEWPDGRRVPLPFVAETHGVRPDSHAFGTLAARMLGARRVPAEAAQFTSLLASALPEARRRLLQLSAARHAGSAGAGRSAALERLMRHAGLLHRTRVSMPHVERALESLATDLPAGLDRLIGRLAADEGATDELARRITEVVGKTGPACGADLKGVPRIVLVAALALAVAEPGNGREAA